ncbi:hypothetical protein EPUL_004899, partial [Erysiphe pulchra]
MRDFIDTNHVYTDDLDEEIIERIREAAVREPEEFVPSGVTQRKGMARRSLAPRLPPDPIHTEYERQPDMPTIRSRAYGSEAETWNHREKIARVVIKNSLGTVDYRQVQSAKTAADVWEILNSLHQPTGAQGDIDMIWKFWSKRCGEGESVRQHIGDVRAIHSDLLEMGIVIDDYLVAIAMSKSLHVSYDNYVSTIFAGIRDLEQAKFRYAASNIFEEARRDRHVRENCYGKGGGKEGQGPRQIAKRKKQEAGRKKIEGKQDQYVQATDEDAFYPSHVALDEKSATESICFTSYSLSHDSWIADSGASAHIANRREMFDIFITCKRTLNVAGGLTATIE